jgi:hypothetical protein
MSTADISPAVNPSLQRKTLASFGYKSQRMYCTKGEKKKERERQRERGKTGEETTSKRQTQGRK